MKVESKLFHDFLIVLNLFYNILILTINLVWLEYSMKICLSNFLLDEGQRGSMFWPYVQETVVGLFHH